MPRDSITEIDNFMIDGQTADNTAEILAPGQRPATYAEPIEEISLPNGCLNFETTASPTWRPPDPRTKTSAPEDFDFTFDETVSNFSLRMLDYGAENHEERGHHKVSKFAYDKNGNEAESQVLEHWTRDGDERYSVNRTITYGEKDQTEVLYNVLWVQGNACDAEMGEPVKDRWQLIGLEL